MVSVWLSMIESALERGAPAEGGLLAEWSDYGRSGVEAAVREWSMYRGTSAGR